MNIREIIKALLALSDADMPEGEGTEGFTAEQLSVARSLASEAATTAIEEKDLTAARTNVETYETLDAAIAALPEEVDVDAELAELAARITAADEADGDDAEDEDDEADGTEEAADPATAEEDDEAEIEVEADAEVEDVVVPIAAAAKTVLTSAQKKLPPALQKAIAAKAKKKKAVPAPTGKMAAAKPKVTITAAADVQGHSAGTNMSVDDLGDAFISKASALSKTSSNGRLDVATLEVEYPQDRFLDSRDNSSVNTEKIMEVMASAQAETRRNLDALLDGGSNSELRSLTAAGGLCAPVNVRYDIFEMGTDSRPIRDALLRFGASRGGIRFNAPPVLSDVDAAVNIYTEAQDAASTGYPKGCIRVTCGADVEVKVYAVPLCMEVGNFQRLSFPENFRAWWKLGKIEHAREAEVQLWERMKTLSVHVTTGETGLGVSRITLGTLARAGQQYRDRFRIGDEAALRIFVPSWLVTMMQVDFMRQAPGDSAVGITRQTIARYLASFNMAVTFVLDGQASGDTGYAQVAGELNEWPASVDLILTVDGEFLFLDMGQLDFGTEIRDFTQIRNNDSGAFWETFENVAHVGPQSLWISYRICASGQTAAANASYDPCTAGY